MKIAQVVINVAKFHEDVEFFYLSKNGSECTLQVSKKHPVKMSRADVLKEEIIEDAGPTLEKVKDVVEKIKAAETIEAVDVIVGEDTRDGVLKAADKRKTELTPVG